MDLVPCCSTKFNELNDSICFNLHKLFKNVQDLYCQNNISILTKHNNTWKFKSGHDIMKIMLHNLWVQKRYLVTLWVCCTMVSEVTTTL